MSYPLEECLQKICKGSELPVEAKQIFVKDAELIRNHLIEKMKENCPQFKATFDGFCLTGSYFDGLNINLPINFELNLKLKMPFKLKPKADHRRSGYVSLLTDDTRDHPIIEKSGRVSRYALQMWIRSVFWATIREGMRFQNEGRVYHIQYPKIGRGRGVAHTVTAIEVTAGKTCDGCKMSAISFDFLPVFAFQRDEWPFKKSDKKAEIPVNMRTWYAIPMGLDLNRKEDKTNSYCFMVATTETNLLATINEKPNLKNALRLLFIIRYAQGFQNLTSYMLKSLFLHEFDENDLDYWKRPTVEILIKLLESLAEDLHEQRLPFFLHKGVNLMDLTTKKIATEYKVKVERCLRKLKNFREIPNCNYSEVLAIVTKQSNA